MIFLLFSFSRPYPIHSILLRTMVAAVVSPSSLGSPATHPGTVYYRAERLRVTRDVRKPGIDPGHPQIVPTCSFVLFHVIAQFSLMEAPKGHSSDRLLCSFAKIWEQSHNCTMANAAPLPAANGNGGITQLNNNDVLLGRGPGLANFEGNRRFRELVDQNKTAYTETTNRKEKKRIARLVMDRVHAAGGRFLRQAGASVNFNAEWHIAPASVAEEKCKQNLREIRTPESPAPSTENTLKRSISDAIGSPDDSSIELKGSSDDHSVSVTSDVPAAAKEAPAAASGMQSNDPSTLENDIVDSVRAAAYQRLVAPALLTHPNVQAAAILQNLLFQGLPVAPTTVSGIDPRLLLFQGPSLLSQQQALIALQQQVAGNSSVVSPSPIGGMLSPELQHEVTNLMSINIAAAAAHQRSLADSAVYSMLRDLTRLQTQNVVDASREIDQRKLDQELSESLVVNEEVNGINTLKVAAKTSGTNVTNTETPSASKEDDITTSKGEEEEVAAFLLSSMAIVNRPVITEEQQSKELASLSSEEKAEILADTFGDLCTVTPHQSKKARIELDPNSVAFLVRQMVLEIEQIPATRKPALMEASSKGRKEEFSDERLEQFLRCEGMNTKVSLTDKLFRVLVLGTSKNRNGPF